MLDLFTSSFFFRAGSRRCQAAVTFRGVLTTDFNAPKLLIVSTGLTTNYRWVSCLMTGQPYYTIMAVIILKYSKLLPFLKSKLHQV
jgi:hypothetical protein